MANIVTAAWILKNSEIVWKIKKMYIIFLCSCCVVLKNRELQTSSNL